MPVEAPELREMSASETRTFSVDMKGKLDDGELLTGTPTVTEVSTSDLELTNKQLSTVEMKINRRKVPAGEAIMFTGRVVGATPAPSYEIDLLCSTDGGQVIDGRVTVNVID